MVKKIQGTGSATGPSGANSVDATKAAEAAGGATEVGGIRGAQEKGQVQKLRGSGQPITAANRDQLFQVIHEEADKMFGPEGLSKSKRKKVEGAVRMVIDASVIGDESKDKK